MVEDRVRTLLESHFDEWFGDLKQVFGKLPMYPQRIKILDLLRVEIMHSKIYKNELISLLSIAKKKGESTVKVMFKLPIFSNRVQDLICLLKDFALTLRSNHRPLVMEIILDHDKDKDKFPDLTLITYIFRHFSVSHSLDFWKLYLKFRQKKRMEKTLDDVNVTVKSLSAEEKIRKLSIEKEKLEHELQTYKNVDLVKTNKLKMFIEKNKYSEANLVADESKLNELLDQCRFKNGKINWSAVGKKIKCTHETAKRRITKLGIPID